MDNTTNTPAPAPINEAMRVSQAQDAVRAAFAKTKEAATSEPVKVTAKTVETKEAAPATVDSDVTDPKISDAFARLGKQESHLREERAKIDSAKKNMESAQKEAEQFRSLQELASSNPLKALETLGLSIESINNHLKELQNPLDPRMKQLIDRQNKLEKERAEEKQAMEQDRVARAEKQVSDNIDKHFATPDFEVLSHINGSKAAVREFMETVYNETGKIPDYKDACEAVLEHVAETYSKIGNHPRLQRKPAEAVAATPTAKVEATPIKHEVKENTRKAGRLAVPKDDESLKGMSESDRLQAAIRAVSAMKK